MQPPAPTPVGTGAVRSAELVVTRPIVLIGLMGVGKSTVGRRLAARLRLPFVDSDVEIEQVSGYSIPEMFDRFGEDDFRDGERRVVKRLIEGGPMVMATGGGVFVNPDTRAIILERTTAVWLDADVEVLAERVSRRDTRPLLRGKDAGAVLTRLAAERRPLYAQAHLHVSTEALPHARAVDAILAALPARGDRL
ncbi:MAG TPA: shikimate kinase [Sphingomonadaceae bacterium]|nr:shikimate kinase [Sphingomonadaceae bacterium]